MVPSWWWRKGRIGGGGAYLEYDIVALISKMSLYNLC